ncbi:MAG: phosphoglucosamine mutase [Clostridia bacterium]|nr:phosphoglucosamine mutase [Clostridia bacterium]
MGKYFGTDGFRGEANVNLTVEHAFKVGRFLGWFYGKNHQDGKAKIVIGKDTRRSSYMFEYSLVAGLTASGADAYLLHVTTTPSVSYVVRTEDFDCGIMISASHNPYYDNGIKLINDKGEKMREDVIDQIEAYLDGDAGELPFATKEKIGCTVDYAAGRNRYMGYLMSLAIYSFKGLRVGLDAANGSAWSIAKGIFDALGARTYVINASPDGTNINNNCGSTHIEGLQDLVRREHLDVGFAFDGDADRCLCVDENGDVITGDHILYIYGCYMKDRDKLVDNMVVTTVMSNFGLYKAFDAAGINYEKTAVGDKYVYECMSQNGYRIGGEQSGHIIFSKYATTGDGIITALKMTEVMLAKKKTMSQLAAPLHIYPQVLKNIRVSNKTEAQNDADVKAAVAAVAESLGEDGRILVRESGTEPVVRVMVEADTMETCEKLVDQVIEVIKNKGYAV